MPIDWDTSYSAINAYREVTADGLHGSALTTTDGRILYQWTAAQTSPDDGWIKGKYFDSVADLLDPLEPGYDEHYVFYNIGVNPTGNFRGEPVGTMWRHPTNGGMYMSMSYAAAMWDGSTGDLGARYEIWRSPSGNGQDWIYSTSVQPPRRVFRAETVRPGNRSTGIPVVLPGGGWVLTGDYMQGQVQDGFYTSPDGVTWTNTYAIGHGPGSAYRFGQSRTAIVDNAGNVHNFGWGGGLSQTRHYYSTDGGASYAISYMGVNEQPFPLLNYEPLTDRIYLAAVWGVSPGQLGFGSYSPLNPIGASWLPYSTTPIINTGSHLRDINGAYLYFTHRHVAYVAGEPLPVLSRWLIDRVGFPGPG